MTANPVPVATTFPYEVAVGRSCIGWMAEHCIPEGGASGKQRFPRDLTRHELPAISPPETQDLSTSPVSEAVGISGSGVDGQASIWMARRDTESKPASIVRCTYAERPFGVNAKSNSHVQEFLRVAG